MCKYTTSYIYKEYQGVYMAGIGEKGNVNTMQLMYTFHGDIQSIPYHIGLFPSLNSKIRTQY